MIPSNGMRLPPEFDTLSVTEFKSHCWNEWDQISFGFYNRKETISQHDRKEGPSVPITDPDPTPVPELSWKENIYDHRKSKKGNPTKISKDAKKINREEKSSESNDEEVDYAELAMKERIARRKSELAEKQSPKVVKAATLPTLEEVVPTPPADLPEPSGTDCVRSRATASEEEIALKERVFQRKKKLAGINMESQEKKNDSEAQKDSENLEIKSDLEKLTQLITEQFDSETNTQGQEIAEAIEQLCLDDEQLELAALRQRHSERKKQLAEKEKIQELERQKAAMAEEAAAEAAASALKERRAERKRQLAEKERGVSPSPEIQRIKFWTLSQLQQKPEGLDVERLESYLEDNEFRQVFEMEKEKFYTSPKVLQFEMKKRVGLV